MEITFIEDSPALLVTREKLLVVGDLHIGRDLKLRSAGIHLPNANQRIAEDLLMLCKKNKAKGLVLLGDVKDSLGYPTKEEYQELGQFFYRLKDIRITITKGNHDPRIEELIKRLDANAGVEKELLLKKVALLHGHAMPSEDAMKKDYIITAHSHPAVDINGRLEKAFAIAKIGSRAAKFYKTYNKSVKLVIMPAFNELITGSEIEGAEKFSPLFRKGIFSVDKIRTYTLSEKVIQG